MLRARHTETDADNSLNAERVVEELRVHQVELELQNEQLRAVERDLVRQNDDLRAAEQELEPSRFRLAVIDQTMPDWPGDRVIEHLHRLAPALPVVLVSGYSAGAPMVDAECVAFVAKPMTLGDLQQAISRLLDGTSQPGAHAARSSNSRSRGSN